MLSLPLSFHFRVTFLALAIMATLPIASLCAETDANAASGVDSVEAQPAPSTEATTSAATVEPAPVNPIDYGAAAASQRPSVEIHPGDAVSAVPKRFQYALRLNMRGVYDDNIYLRHTDRVSDVYFAIEPGITLGFGDIVGRDQNSIRLDYAPSIFIYGDHSEADAVQHVIRLDGSYRMGHLSLSLAQDIQLLEGTTNPGSANFGSGTNPTPTLNLDTGGNTEVNIYTTNAGFSYDLTGKTFLSGGLSFSAYDYQNNLISSEQIQGNVFINYIYSPKLTVGLGGTVGYNWVDGNNPDQSFQQVNVRTNYELTGKVSLDASLGLEFRQYENSNDSDTNISPVYELGLTYQPFDGTNVTLRGTRRILNSAVFAGQDYESTNITLGIRQRFLRRIYIGVVGGYERTDYFNTVQNILATRSDDYFFIQPGVDVTLTRYWTVGGYYLHRRDDSSFPGFSFYDNQVGLRTSLTF